MSALAVTNYTVQIKCGCTLALQFEFHLNVLNLISIFLKTISKKYVLFLRHFMEELCMNRHKLLNNYCCGHSLPSVFCCGGSCGRDAPVGGLGCGAKPIIITKKCVWNIFKNEKCSRKIKKPGPNTFQIELKTKFASSMTTQNQMEYLQVA